MSGLPGVTPDFSAKPILKIIQQQYDDSLTERYILSQKEVEFLSGLKIVIKNFIVVKDAVVGAIKLIEKQDHEATVRLFSFCEEMVSRLNEIIMLLNKTEIMYTNIKDKCNHKRKQKEIPSLLQLAEEKPVSLVSRKRSAIESMSSVMKKQRKVDTAKICQSTTSFSVEEL